MLNRVVTVPSPKKTNVMTTSALGLEMNSTGFDSCVVRNAECDSLRIGSEAAELPPVAESSRNRVRKLNLLRRSGLFGDDTKGAVIERASSFEDLSQAFRLVHDVYLNRKYIHPEPSGMRVRLFEALAENATFVAKKEGRVVGVLSMVGDSADLGLPSDSVFRRELDERRARGARLCELTNQVVADEFRKTAVPAELMRCALAHGMSRGYREGVAVVCPSHNGFYDMMGFREIGTQRSYSDTIDEPVVALALDFETFLPSSTASRNTTIGAG